MLKKQLDEQVNSLRKILEAHKVSPEKIDSVLTPIMHIPSGRADTDVPDPGNTA